jgi:hypothetical protein
MEFTRKRPDPGSQICGYQLQIGGPDNGGDDRWCVRRKARGLHHCQDCEDRLARDEARGCIRIPTRAAIGVGLPSTLKPAQHRNL